MNSLNKRSRKDGNFSSCHFKVSFENIKIKEIVGEAGSLFNSFKLVSASLIRAQSCRRHRESVKSQQCLVRAENLSRSHVVWLSGWETERGRKRERTERGECAGTRPLVYYYNTWNSPELFAFVAGDTFTLLLFKEKLLKTLLLLSHRAYASFLRLCFRFLFYYFYLIQSILLRTPSRLDYICIHFYIILPDQLLQRYYLYYESHKPVIFLQLLHLISFNRNIRFILESILLLGTFYLSLILKPFLHFRVVFNGNK